MKLRFGIAATALAALALSVAPSASAELGVTSYFQFPTQEFGQEPPFGAVGNLRSAYVNHDGTGGASAGDVYAGDFRYSAAGDPLTPSNGGFVNQATGETFFISPGGLVEVSSATGTFLRSFGYDAVSSGPDDSSVDEQQRLTIFAAGGNYTLSCCTLNGVSPTTIPLPYNASAQELEDALNELGIMEAAGSHVTVTGGPSGPADPGPYVYTITLGGILGGDDFTEWDVSTGHLTGNTVTGRIDTLVDGGGIETCIAANGDVCHLQFSTGRDFPKPIQGAIGNEGSLALAPTTAPNAGNVLVADWQYMRIDEFLPTGSLARSFGWDVNSSGPNDSSADEQQKLTIEATGGKFSLSFPDVFDNNHNFVRSGPTTGAIGTGEVTNGSNAIANLDTTDGVFEIGQTITGTGIPTGTTVTGVAAHSLTMSANATSGAATSRKLTADDIPFNASAAEVKAALESLPSIGGAGGSVVVTGPNGGPYTVTFGGTVGGDELEALGTSSAALTGGGKSATVATLANGGAFETCVVAAGDSCKVGVPGKEGVKGSKLGQFAGNSAALTSIAEDSTGAVYVANGPRPGFFADTNYRIQKFTPSGPGFTPSVCCAPEKQSVKVSAGGGQFRLTYFEPDGTRGTGDTHQGSTLVDNVTTTKGEFVVGQPIRTSDGFSWIANGTTIAAVGPSTITLSQPAPLSGENNLISTRPWQTADLKFDATAPEVENALDALPPIAAESGSVSVSEGPGSPSGSTPYKVDFDSAPLNGQDQQPMIGSDGATPLSGGTGADADEAIVSTIQDGQPSGLTFADSPIGVAIDNADDIYVDKYFPAGSATCPDGSPSRSETRIQKFATDGTFAGTSAPCYGIPPSGGIGGNPELSVDPVSGEPYLAIHECCAAVPTLGFGAFAFIFGELGPAPTLTLDPPSEIGPTGVTLSGEIDPHGPVTAAGHPNPTTTTYQVQLRVNGESEWTTYAPPTSVGFDDNPVPFSVGISGLTPKTTYDFRLIVAKRGRPDVIGPVQTTTTAPAPPSVDNLRSSSVTASTADLHARINARGTDTTYHFEYGKTIAYGQQTPDTDIGASQFAVDVNDHLEGLEPSVYHFRVVATNSLGTTRSADQTFNFYPEPCPNEAVRQQTGAARLPDCRAYELVSPENAGSASLFAGGPNSPYATSPSRLSFYGILGTVPGTGNPPNVLGDQYVATRTNSGWKTAYVGIPANQYWIVGGPPNGGGLLENPTFADRTMSQFLDWQHGQQGFSFGNELGSMAPYVWDASGNSLGRFPTNLGDVPGGTDDLAAGGFIGAVKPSADFSHYFFSSANVAFAPGGQTSGNGSVYDNDVAKGTVTVASKLPDGADIAPEPGDLANDYFSIPDASVDGSHVLIGDAGTGICGKATCNPAPGICAELATNVGECPDDLPLHLYMRVDGALTYDVTQGHLVAYRGMSEDGSVVYFTSAQKITADDHDTSVDLYRWSEATDAINRVSAGSSGVVGDTNACSPSWTSKCNVEVVPTEAAPGSFAAAFSKSSDNAIAAGTGDVYFYSPEQFIGGKGVPGRRNLYVYRGGNLRYVATLDANLPLTRIQVSPDGLHAAFITATRLTAYDNDAVDGNCAPEEFGVTPRAGCEEMYAYDVAADSLTCVSCILTGEPPASDVSGSQNGIYMSHDGRTFFATSDGVVPDDTNHIIDVYEYVDGRPQLVSSGTGETDRAITGQAGLVGVSVSGVDVYFATFQKLVPEDRNGQFLRFYDARTNGGFTQAAPLIPCEAADECHGPTSGSPTPPTVASSAALGPGGNLSPKAQKKTCKKHRHCKRRRHRGHRPGSKGVAR